MRTIKILAISGSLRANSSNAAVLKAAASFFNEDVEFVYYNGLGTLPHFDDSPTPGPEVTDFRKQLKEADGILICSPEYAFGVPGSLKNALDWTVSSGELVNKPLGLITAATGGQNAHAALQLIFTALSARLTPASTLLISYVRSKMNKEGEITDQNTLSAIQSVTKALLQTIELTLNEIIDN